MPILGHGVLAITAVSAALLLADRHPSEPTVAMEVLEEAATEWRTVRPAHDGAAMGCKLNLIASNGGSRAIAIDDDSQVRTALGWWARLMHADMFLRAGAGVSQVVEVDLACSAKRRFRLVLRQYDTARLTVDTRLAGSYTYYYPSSTTFTSPGTVDIRLGDLDRFFK